MKKKIYDERFDIRMPSKLLKAGEKYARDNHITLSQLLRSLLLDELNRSGFLK